MKLSSMLMSAALAIGLAVAGAGAAVAQATQDNMPSGMMQRDGGTGMMGPGMMGPGMMDQGMMRRGMMGNGMMPGSAGQGMPCPMMNSAMMQRGMMGSAMMGPAMMNRGARSDGALFGTRVTPIMNLSVDDVRGYLDLRLKRLGNKRLKVGNVAAEGDTITADVVTVDNSLVQRLKVDRHTGAIEYVE